MKGSRVYITGLDGFTGRYLAKKLALEGYEIANYNSSGAILRAVNLLDFDGLKNDIVSFRPDYVFHLAAASAVGDDVARTYSANVVGTVNLLRILTDEALDVKKVIIASSANIYGNSDYEVLNESVHPRPENHYGISKYSMELASAQWFKLLPIILVRPFNYTGVGQSDRFIIPKIVSHFSRHEKVIELGNVDVFRDFSDVRDVVDWYEQLINSSFNGGVVNFCSGRLLSLANVIEYLNDFCGYKINVNVNPKFVRQNEIIRLRGCNEKLKQCISYYSARPINETLSWMVEAGLSKRSTPS